MSRRIKKSSIKFLIPLVLLFMFIGFATVSTTLSINGDMELLSDLEDFNIYYSRAVVNGEEDPSIIKSSTELDFGAALKTIGVDYVIEYDITNASSAFDAQVSINCSASTEYFSINNEFDSDTPIGSRQTRTGTMTLRKIQTVAGDEQSNTISCDIVATPVERESEGSGEVPIPLEKYDPYKIGTEVSIGSEKFNIISSDDTTVTMLAQYNIATPNNTYFMQNQTLTSYQFSSSLTWTYTSGVATDLDIATHASGINNNILKYIGYIQTYLGSYNSIVGNLITLKQLIDLGCTAPIDYVQGSGEWTCDTSLYKEWLVNGQVWWTRSLSGSDSAYRVNDSGTLGSSHYGNTTGPGIRPVITIGKEIVDILLYSYNVVGTEIDINGEKFNIISHDGDVVSMLAQYNVDDETFLQTEEKQWTILSGMTINQSFCYENELIIGDLVGGAFDVFLGYSNTLLDFENYFSVQSIDLISLKQLKALGCTISEDYSAATGMSCSGSPYVEWLDNGQQWWTKSFVSDSTSNFWFVYNSELYSHNSYDMTNGIRPVVTVSKFELLNLGV